jgi:hypothetical protein
MPEKTISDAELRALEEAIGKAYTYIENVGKALSGPGRVGEILARRRLDDTNTGCCGNCGNSQCSCKAAAFETQT